MLIEKNTRTDVVIWNSDGDRATQLKAHAKTVNNDNDNDDDNNNNNNNNNNDNNKDGDEVEAGKLY